MGEWDESGGRAYLLRVAADLIEDETPFLDEADHIANAALDRAETMSEERFRELIANHLEWDESAIDQAVANVCGPERGEEG